jgi:chromosome segregation ATPase
LEHLKELRKDMSVSQEELEYKMSTIKAGQNEFEEMIIDTLDMQLKGFMAAVQQQSQNLHKFSSELQVTRQDVEVTWMQAMGIGGMLSQVQEGQGHVVAYYSRTLSNAERDYCVT